MPLNAITIEHALQNIGGIRCGLLVSAIWLIYRQLSGRRMKLFVEYSFILLSVTIGAFLVRTPPEVGYVPLVMFRLFTAFLFCRVVMGSSRTWLIKFPNGSVEFRSRILGVSGLGITLLVGMIYIGYYQFIRMDAIWGFLGVVVLSLTVVLVNGIISDALVVLAAASAFIAKSGSNTELFALRCLYVLLTIFGTLFLEPSRKMEPFMFHIRLTDRQSRFVCVLLIIIDFLLQPSAAIPSPSDNSLITASTIMGVYAFLLVIEYFSMKQTGLMGYCDEESSDNHLHPF